MKLILDKVSQSFPGRKVFKDVSAEIEEGKTLVITGPNGSGKTTLLKLISATLTPSSGKVRFDYNGVELSGVDILPHIGMVTPELFLYEELTAIENLEFFASVSGAAQINILADMARFGLEGRGNDLVKSYSSGMKQRLKYMLALLRKPPLLLLDEPTANLDDKGKALVQQIIAKHSGITVIATNEEADLKYADKSIILGQ
jgi:heme exporter protein A